RRPRRAHRRRLRPRRHRGGPHRHRPGARGRLARRRRAAPRHLPGHPVLGGVRGPMRPLALSACAALLAACVGDKPPPDPAARSEEVRTYLSALAPILVSRTLSADEIALIEQKVADEGQIAVARQVLSGWLGEPALADAARELIQTRLSVSGSGIDGVNYELPGNLAAWTVVNGAPWSTLVTADFCVGDDLSMIE